MNKSALPRLVAVVLAAGQSRRFGTTKQLASLGQAPLVRRAVDNARGAPVDAVVLATGHDQAAVHAAGNSDFFLVNENYRDGMGSTLAQAARTLAPVTDGLLVCLADQPLIPAEHLAALREAWDGSPDRAIATAFGSSVGPPVLFGSRYFADLGNLRGEAGAKALLDAAGDQLVTIRLEAAAIDIDRPEDLENL
jgi:molybdenum cofactor cytidylyltransferase